MISGKEFWDVSTRIGGYIWIYTPMIRYHLASNVLQFLTVYSRLMNELYIVCTVVGNLILGLSYNSDLFTELSVHYQGHHSFCYHEVNYLYTIKVIIISVTMR